MDSKSFERTAPSRRFRPGAILAAGFLAFGLLPVPACGGGDEMEQKVEEAMEEIGDEAEDAREEIQEQAEEARRELEDELDDRT
jgi:hypothetical protein